MIKYIICPIKPENKANKLLYIKKIFQTTL